MEETKVAFIGAGGNASGHMSQVKELEGTSIVAISTVEADLVVVAGFTRLRSSELRHHGFFCHANVELSGANPQGVVSTGAAG